LFSASIITPGHHDHLVLVSMNSRAKKYPPFHSFTEVTTMLRNLFGTGRGRKGGTAPSFRPTLAALEDRCLPSVVALPAPPLAAPALSAGTTSGSATDMPAFYDGRQFTINFKQVTGIAAQSLLSNNKSINIIYTSNTSINGQPFVMVLNAMRGPGEGPGFNPLWQQVQITFNTIPPQQFTSDNAILAAAAAGQITLTPTTTVFRCSVVGGQG
jgi:hypothetical protein